MRSEFRTAQRGLRYPPEILAQFGAPPEAILRAASEREADLIVLGVRPANGHLGATTHFGRAVAHRIIVGAACPVLTVVVEDRTLRAVGTF